MYAFIRSFIEILADLERFKAFRWSSSIDAEMQIFPVLGSKDIRCLSNRASWLAHKSKPLFASIRSSLEDSAHSLIWLARNTDVVEISQRLQWWRSRSNSLRKEPCETRVFTIFSTSVPAHGLLFRVRCKVMASTSSQLTSFEIILYWIWCANTGLYEGFIAT